MVAAVLSWIFWLFVLPENPMTLRELPVAVMEYFISIHVVVLCVAVYKPTNICYLLTALELSVSAFGDVYKEA